MKFYILHIVILVIICILITITKAALVANIELNDNWSLSNQNKTITKSGLKVPTGVYSAVSGEEVLKSYNDVNMRWISYDNWTYTKNFSINVGYLKHAGNVNLTFHGLDTIAEIRLNKHIIGYTENMFVRYSFNVKKYLKENNQLEVKITSPVYAALEKANVLAAEKKSVPPNCPSKQYKGECHMNMLRKMQASFSWDWGLAAPSMGIWKSVALEWYEVALIRDIDIATSKNDTHWILDARVFIEAAADEDFYANLSIYAGELFNNKTINYDFSKKKLSFMNPIIKFQQALPNNAVELWWPNGYGKQKLYDFNFTLNAWLNENGAQESSKSVSKKSLRIGFRTIELVEERVGNGNTFLFKVNGAEIFMKGSNYIPAHILPELGSHKASIKHLLQSAKHTHMNMLRVWGGGVYESDYFYDLADEYGILIWQDMMFACAMYPVTKDFLATVRTEARQNALRLSHHASIAIFATNNENEVALAQNWYYPTILYQKRFKQEYRELYLHTVMDELKIISHKARVTPLVSSPSNGKESAKENYLSKQPQDPNYGDVHFYDYIRDGWNQNTYPRPRFSSEYGIQSLPQMKSWQRVLNPKDDLLKLINHRQHHTMGDLPIINLVRRHLPLPASSSNDYAEALIYFSQISQAMSVKVETELYRSLRDTEHRTMGALYWQLNDVWVAPSWSSIDFYGNYKLLHYWAKEFMAPIAIFAIQDTKTKTINVSIACDHLKHHKYKYQVTQNIYNWSDLMPKSSKTWPVTLQANGVRYDKQIPIEHILTGNFTEKNTFIEFNLKRGKQLISRTHVFPAPIKLAEGLADAELSLNITSNACLNKNELKMNIYNLVLNVKRPAVFVYIEVIHKNVIHYKLSHNGFMQTEPMQTVYLQFESEDCILLTRDNIKILTVNQFMKRGEPEKIL